MSLRPDTNGAAATCIRDYPAAATQDGRETFYMKPLSEIINASCSGRSTWWPEVPPSLTEFFAPEEDDIGREVQ